MPVPHPERIGPRPDRTVSTDSEPAPTFTTPIFTTPNFGSRIPSLDGLRAFSICLVLIAHVSLQDAVLRQYVEHVGNYGVRIFFVISGFLITGLLLKERRNTGRISLKNFYLRRTLRIFPAFYVYVLTVLMLSWAGIVVLMPGDLLHTFTYTMNYHMDRSWWLNHVWSLSVEEQFYVLWPTVLVFAGMRRGLKAAVAMIVAAPIVRAILLFYFDASPTALGRHFEAVAGALASGCVLAAMYEFLGQRPEYVRFAKAPGSLAAALALLVLPSAMFAVSPASYYLVGQSIANLGTVLLIDRSVRFPDSLSGRFLNWSPVVLIGTWSYSIYLWQELFLAHELDGFHLEFPLNLLAVFGAALLSYYLVEVNFRTLGHKRVRTIARPSFGVTA
jgi:peptidoglycan/LPS O-acetylase OafA/YrhL